MIIRIIKKKSKVKQEVIYIRFDVFLKLTETEIEATKVFSGDNGNPAADKISPRLTVANSFLSLAAIMASNSSTLLQSIINNLVAVV